LPDDVFQPGESRPTRPKKKVIRKTESTGQKRRLGEMHVSQHEENEIEPDSAMISTLELGIPHPAKKKIPSSGIAGPETLILFSIQDSSMDASQGAAKRQVTPSTVSNTATPA
jgi:hypothetical protein